MVSRRADRSHSSRFWWRHLKLNVEKTRRERVPPTLRRFFWDVNIKRTEERERDIELCLKKGRKKKNKEQNKTVFTFSRSCVSSRHDEHCAFLAVCGLKFFTVLAQFVGVNVSSLLKLL